MNAPKTITDLQAQALIAANQTVRNRAICSLLYYAALRVNELVQLTQTDLWFPDDVVLNLTIRPTTTKTHLGRTIPLHPFVRENIRQLHAHVWRHTHRTKPNFAFYYNVPHRHLNVRQARRIVLHAGLKALNIPVHPHMLRHTFATRLMRVTNIRVVQAFLGHKHLSSTQIYTHPNQDDLKNAIDHLDTQT